MTKGKIISKEAFVNTMKSIETDREFQNQLQEVLRKYCCDSTFFYTSMESAIIELLMEVFDDKDEWIKYCVYELDYLRDYQEDSASRSDGTPIDLSTWESVYDFLIETMNDI